MITQIFAITLWIIIYLNFVVFYLKIFNAITEKLFPRWYLWLLALTWPIWTILIMLWLVVSAPYWWMMKGIDLNKLGKKAENGKNKSSE